MNLNIKQVSSLEKIRPTDNLPTETMYRKTVLGGESFSYQIAVKTTDNTDLKDVTELKMKVISELSDCVKLYAVKNINMDMPSFNPSDDDYITKEPGLMPDMLMPLELSGNSVRFVNEAGAIWVTVDVPRDTKAGEYPVKILLTLDAYNEKVEIEQTLVLDVVGANIPEQQTIFTQWFHVDCIADVHNVPIYSEEHWSLIDKYMSLASYLGINMILTPVITPPLDTAVGLYRPCTQLVKIEKIGDKYKFDFSLLKRWVDLVIKNGIKYFEISHLFSQWGLSYTPNIKVWENGKETDMFGWHMAAQAPEYREFLKQFLPSLLDFLAKENLKDRCWFHVSDEPSYEHLDAYRYARDTIKPFIDGCPMFDALSDYSFYKNGLVEIPVTSTDHIEPFLENKVDNQWAYYCCAQYNQVGNRFLAMPSYRNRILGLQMYKYGIKGFLQWGYNFYYSHHSRNKINPYLTSSADKSFPSGDAYSVYPINDRAVPSLRAINFKEALSDIEICRMLEGFIGRHEVIKMIDDEAGMNLTFSDYPRDIRFIPRLMEKMVQLIKLYVK